MKKIIVVALLALLMNVKFVYALDRTNPADVGNAFLTYFLKGDGKTALTYTNEATFLEPYLGKEESFLKIVKERSTSIHDNLGGVKEISIDKVSINKEGTEALLDITIEYNKAFNQQTAEHGFLFMIKIDDEWKVKYMDRR